MHLTEHLSANYLTKPPRRSMFTAFGSVRAYAQALLPPYSLTGAAAANLSGVSQAISGGLRGLSRGVLAVFLGPPLNTLLLNLARAQVAGMFCCKQEEGVHRWLRWLWF